MTLTDDGGPNLINGGVSLSLVSGDTYAIGGLMGLTSAQGEYTLTVNAADIQDQNGVAGTNSLFTSWLMDTSAPSSHVVNSLGTSQTSDTFPVSVTFSDPAGPGNAPAAGVSAVQLWLSVNNGAFSLYQTMDISPTASGTATFRLPGKIATSMYSSASRSTPPATPRARAARPPRPAPACPISIRR